MLNSVRIFWTIVIYATQLLSHTSPNTGKEMGTQQGDRVADHGKIDNFFLRFMIFTSVYSYYVFNMIVYHGEDTVTIYDAVLIGTTIAGFALRMWCFWSLGKHFTFTLGTRQNHELIETGPYKYLIHPSYTAQIMSMFGSLVFLRGNWLAIISLVCAHFTLQKRIAVEEDMLERQFGEKYCEYKKKRSRFIPLIY